MRLPSNLKQWARSGILSCLMLFSMTALLSKPVLSQSSSDYPNRPVTIIVPFPPGGGTDISARLIAQKLSVRWGHPVVVENRGGAAGQLGADAVAKAAPDGYTLLVGNVGTQSVNPELYAKMSYNPDRAFEPIAMIGELPLVLLVSPNQPYKTLQDIISAAKASPGKLTYASSGSGGAPHLAAEIMLESAGIKILHVPYKGGGPAVMDVMAGHVDMIFATVLESIGYIKSGKLRGIAVSSAKRSPALPDVPTISESGIPGFDTGSWVGLFAPYGTDTKVVSLGHDSVNAILDQAETDKQLIDQGATPLAMTREAFINRIASDRIRYGTVIRSQGIKPE